MSQLVKTVNDLAIASVKSVNGLAIASVKALMGLDNTVAAGGFSDNFDDNSLHGDWVSYKSGTTVFTITEQNQRLEIDTTNGLSEWCGAAVTRFGALDASTGVEVEFDYYHPTVDANQNAYFFFTVDPLSMVGASPDDYVRGRLRGIDLSCDARISGITSELNDNNGILSAVEYHIKLKYTSTTLTIWLDTVQKLSELHSYGATTVHFMAGFFTKGNSTTAVAYIDNLTITEL